MAGGQSFFPAGVGKTISLVSIREALFRTYVPVKCRHFFGPSFTRNNSYRYVFFRLNTTHNTNNKQLNTATEQRAWLTPAAYSTATLSSSSSTVTSHGHVWQVYMLPYYCCCGYLFFSDPRSIIPQHYTPLSLCFFNVLLCVIRHYHCPSRARHSAPTAAGSVLCTYMWQIRAVLSALQHAVSGVCCGCLRRIGL